jgi:hypothetical protein
MASEDVCSASGPVIRRACPARRRCRAAGSATPPARRGRSAGRSGTNSSCTDNPRACRPASALARCSPTTCGMITGGASTRTVPEASAIRVTPGYRGHRGGDRKAAVAPMDAVAAQADVLGAPDQQRAVRAQRHVLHVAGRQLGDAGQPGDLLRRADRRPGETQAELPATVVAPGPQPTRPGPPRTRAWRRPRSGWRSACAGPR